MRMFGAEIYMLPELNERRYIAWHVNHQNLKCLEVRM